MFRILWGLVVAMALAAPAMAQNGYQIRPGDTLRVEVMEDPNLNRNVLVLPDGSFSFPLVGTVSAGGRTVDQVGAALSNALAPNFAVPASVFVSIGGLAERRATGPAAQRMMDVYVIGEVAAPGRKEVRPGTTLLQFLAESGGFTRFAADRRIELHRAAEGGGANIYRFNYRTRGGQGGISGMTVLAPGDVIVVPERRLFE